MKVYEVIVRIIDHDGIGPEQIKAVIENQRWPNHCINPTVGNVRSAEIGEWEDDNPLNLSESAEAEWRRLFP